MKKLKVNLFVLGAAKCGTTSLHSYLDEHPNICMSSPKEPYFFECEFDNGYQYYNDKYFSHYNSESIVGESRHRNLYLEYIPERIKNYNPNAKFIILLRNPVERAFSHWWHFYSRGLEDLNFKDAITEDLKRIEDGLKIDNEKEIINYCANLNGRLNGTYRTYIDSGYYLSQIQRYVKIFSKEKILIILSNDLQTQRQSVMNSITKFLNIEPFEKEKINFESKNEKKIIRNNSLIIKILRFLKLNKLVPFHFKHKLHKYYTSRVMQYHRDKNTIDLLKNHFKEHNIKLEQFINKDLSNWNK